jgi:hypothetical protein
MNTSSNTPLSEAERKRLLDDENDRVSQEDALDDVRAEQQMLESPAGTDEAVRRLERHRSLDKDEPDDDLDRLDPVPPDGD